MKPLLTHLMAPGRLMAARLDATGMYRTVTLGLLFISLCALVAGTLEAIPYTALEQLISLFVAVVVALSTNWLCARLWKVAVNMESALITGLILYLLILPAQLAAITDVWLLAAAVALAIFSKYVFAWRKQHIVNPAAAGLVLLALLYSFGFLPGYFESSWWVGQAALFVPLLIAGTFVVTKVRKWIPVLSFLIVGFIVYLIEDLLFFGNVTEASALRYWLSGPSLFLAFFMLTEPFTTPPTKHLQAGYGALVGLFSQTTLFTNIGIKMTPELALILGNVIFYPATLKRKLVLTLERVHEMARHTYEFTFLKPIGLRYQAGQYLEWMLPHTADNRGERRYFTIASAPSDAKVKIAIRFGEKVSSYKTALRALAPGGKIIASQLAGDFLLPGDNNKKIAFIAGGIGITPFMSQLGEMHYSGKRYNTVLFYANNTEAEIAYKDQLQALSKTLPLKVVHVVAKERVAGCELGFLTAGVLLKHTPDYKERYWYISGPPGMVNAYKKMLREMKVPRKQIICDFFPGLA